MLSRMVRGRMVQALAPWSPVAVTSMCCLGWFLSWSHLRLWNRGPEVCLLKGRGAEQAQGQGPPWRKAYKGPPQASGHLPVVPGLDRTRVLCLMSLDVCRAEMHPGGCDP